MKCDEGKPTCQQCVRRGITCGGYRKDLKWKAFGKPKSPKSGQPAQFIRQTLLSDIDMSSEDTSAFRESLVSAELPDLNGNIGSEGNPIPDSAVGPFDVTSHCHSELCSQTEENLLGFGLPAADWTLSPGLSPLRSDFQLATLTDRVTDDDDADHTLLLSGIDYFDWSAYGFDAFEDILSKVAPLEALPQSYGTAASSPGETQGLSPTHSFWRPPPPSSATRTENLTISLEQPYISIGDEEMISLVFHQHTCLILSIDDAEQPNPWRDRIWPLAKDYPALYHAIAAMTCFHISRLQPQFRTQGAQHVQSSMEGLAVSVNNNTISLDAALAATLALAWAETWDNQRSSTGKTHIDGARTLVKQACNSKDRFALLDFLINNFTYMDVIARLTSSFDDMSLTKPISSYCRVPDDKNHLDPLMGYATTLFPLIGAVADLVGCIRARPAKGNSPAVISRAIELKNMITRWQLSADLETMDDSRSTNSDAVQTAESYRWATLLLLQQAVPEIPPSVSLAQLAQRVLIYLATTPPSTSTLIVQIFPLMMAGCEAIEEEDREWVDDRWEAMSKAMVTGIVQKCTEVTKETWRRRDMYASENGFCRNTGAKLLDKSSPSPTINETTGTIIRGQFRDTHKPQCSKAVAGSCSPDFPVSAVFKKGVDSLTRSGCLDYTVRGRLHWLGVMQDFGWEVMLG
ncbi:fungal-specific transcription factor domain-containing protein [Dendryphion nanum]|uniref:Fungal-specific transcription factor domain-containing protein n=1 Tax=Dendryphion nanum TaxID=256645 RepID=A0A9P9D5U0_9PLEO|nr:fungal-specific transcription factor domain-containing protein [Dendryphion nanum]